MSKGVFCLMHLGQVRGSIYEGLRDCSEKSHRPKGVIGLMHFEQVKRSTWEGLKESFECPLGQRESSTRLLERKFWASKCLPTLKKASNVRRNMNVAGNLFEVISFKKLIAFSPVPDFDTYSINGSTKGGNPWFFIKPKKLKAFWNPPWTNNLLINSLYVVCSGFNCSTFTSSTRSAWKATNWMTPCNRNQLINSSSY